MLNKQRFRTQHILALLLASVILITLTSCASKPKPKRVITGVPQDFSIDYYSNDTLNGKTRRIRVNSDGTVQFLGGIDAMKRANNDRTSILGDSTSIEAQERVFLTSAQMREIYEMTQKLKLAEVKGEWFPDGRIYYEVGYQANGISNRFNVADDAVPGLMKLGDKLQKYAVASKYEELLNQVDVRKREIELERERENNE